LGGYLERRGLRPADDALARMPYGWLGLTDRTLIVARQRRWFGSLGPQHVVVEASRETCTAEWYDVATDTRFAGRRYVIVFLGGGRFASFKLGIPRSGRDEYVAALQAGAAGTVEWFGMQATRIDVPA
jgi:hypothetical protein